MFDYTLPHFEQLNYSNNYYVFQFHEHSIYSSSRMVSTN